jgi:hypothetical protein
MSFDEILFMIERVKDKYNYWRFRSYSKKIAKEDKRLKDDEEYCFYKNGRV